MSPDYYLAMSKAWKNLSHRLTTILHVKLNAFGALSHIDSVIYLNAQTITNPRCCNNSNGLSLQLPHDGVGILTA